MDKTDYEGIERRSYFRVEYNPRERPVLQIGNEEFAIIDISEGGIRLINESELKIKKQIEGKLKFLDNEQLNIKGTIEWIERNQVGVCLKIPIPTAIIMREHRYVILNYES